MPERLGLRIGDEALHRSPETKSSVGSLHEYQVTEREIFHRYPNLYRAPGEDCVRPIDER